MKQTTTVNLHRSNNQVFFRSAVPNDLAKNFLGLTVDQPKQRLSWELKDNQLVVRKVD